MIALRIEFLAGRFHANPWDRGTNDGEVDWPPSPWRLLRAIVSGWYRSGAEDRDAFLCILDRIADAPRYLLPWATAGHSRHYMPLGTGKNGKLDTTLVLDSFIAFEAGRETTASAYVIWPHVVFSSDEFALLQRCCDGIPYLGRAESWCRITVSEAPLSEEGFDLVDLASRPDVGSGMIVRRLGAGSSLRGNGLFVALTETTAKMRKRRRLTPVGTAWLEYLVPHNFLLVREQFEKRECTEPVFDGQRLLRFMLERGRRSPKPSIKDALLFSEALRSAAMRQYSVQNGGPASLRLAGKSPEGGKAQGHDHVYFLPFDQEGRGDIDGIDVWFPSGCTHAEYRAVIAVTKLYDHVAYNGDEFALTFLGLIAPTQASNWSTVTPIVLERFPKIRGTGDQKRVVDSAAEQIRRMLERAGHAPAVIAIWEPGAGIKRSRGGPIRVDAFRRARPRKTSAPLPVVAATVEFEASVSGPLVLGSLAHFGLGRFEPIAPGA
jgi:CRISPR-associated protein Csb2